MLELKHISKEYNDGTDKKVKALKEEGLLCEKEKKY